MRKPGIPWACRTKRSPHGHPRIQPGWVDREGIWEEVDCLFLLWIIITSTLTIISTDVVSLPYKTLSTEGQYKPFSFSLFQLINFIFYFYVHSKIEEKVQKVPVYPHLHTHIHPLLPPPASFTRMGQSLQSVTLHWNAISIQSSELTLGFTRGDVHSMVSDKCRMTWIPHLHY